MESLEEAEAVGFLHVELLDQPLAGRVTRAIKEVAAGVLAGAIRPQITGKFDEETVQEYRKGLQLLLEATPAIGEPIVARPRAS